MRDYFGNCGNVTSTMLLVCRANAHWEIHGFSITTYTTELI